MKLFNQKLVKSILLTGSMLLITFSTLSVASDQTVVNAKAVYNLNPSATNLALVDAARGLGTSTVSAITVVGTNGLATYQALTSVDDGIPFSFIDISGTGTMVTTGDDVASGPIILDEPFVFYDKSVTSVSMATNGYISTDENDTGPDLSNDCPLPATPSTPGGTTGARIYPLHDDLVSTGYVEYFPVCPRASDTGDVESCTIFQWDDTMHWPTSATWDMQAILYHSSNTITYQIGAGDPNQGGTSTTGIQSYAPNPSTGLTVSCNTAGSVPDNYAVSIFLLPPAAIPTLSLSGLMALILLMLGVAGVGMRLRKS